MIGKVFGARYEIIEGIDSGGMANVYKAKCRKTNSTVAVKILKDKFSNSEEYVKRFKKEAESVFSLEHDNIVHITDIGYDQKSYYMVMEYVDGPSLKTLIQEKTKIDETDAIRYAIQACSALSVAHRKGIIHRDIKPQNILVTKHGDIKVTDFGIAKSVSEDDEDEKQVIGSVYYVSPEQAKGDKVDIRTDIYSLGIVLYEMLTGVVPFTGDKTVAVALKHINEQITAPAEKNNLLSKSINNIVLKAISKSKKDRYQSMNAFKEDLVRALADPSGLFVNIPAVNINRDPKRSSTHKKNKVWKICILIVLIAVVMSIIVIGADVLYSSPQETFIVPKAMGINVALVEEQMKDNNLSVEITYESSETVREGFVINQTPESGSEVTGDTIVTLTVSSGPADLIMPDVYGLTLEEAEVYIQSMGLVIEDVIYELREGVDPGEVVSQIPEPGDVIMENDPVSLIVADELVQDSAVLPQMSDMLVDQAISLLYDKGFENCYVHQEESEMQEGTVIRQSPEQGLQTPFVSDIDLTISAYTTKEYAGSLHTVVEVPEKESKVKIVLTNTINGNTMNFVVLEQVADAGSLPINIDIESLDDGIKTVRILINNIEVYTNNEVEFVRKREIE